MDESDQKKGKSEASSSLEIDQSARLEIEERQRVETEERTQRIRRIAQEKNENRERMQAAMNEKAQSGGFRISRPKALAFFAIVLALYFLSLATKDKNNFNDGMKILKSGAWQLFVVLSVAGLVNFVFGKLSLKRREFFDRLGLWVFLGMAILGLLFLRGVIGLVYRLDSRGGASGLNLWLSREFLFTLGIQVGLGVAFFKIRKNILKRIELGEVVVVGARSIVVFCEGVQIYLWLGVFLQLVFQVHTVAFYRIMFSGFTTGFLFLIPLFGYCYIRRYLLSLH
jgi:hypothetical protein